MAPSFSTQLSLPERPSLIIPPKGDSQVRASLCVPYQCLCFTAHILVQNDVTCQILSYPSTVSYLRPTGMTTTQGQEFLPVGDSCVPRCSVRAGPQGTGHHCLCKGDGSECNDAVPATCAPGKPTRPRCPGEGFITQPMSPPWQEAALWVHRILPFACHSNALCVSLSASTALGSRGPLPAQHRAKSQIRRIPRRGKSDFSGSHSSLCPLQARRGGRPGL